MPLLQKKDIWLSQLRAGLITPEQYAKRKQAYTFDSAQPIDGFVPYTGAEYDVNLGEHTLEITAQTGKAPFIISSTTLINNLNADLLDGYDADDFINADLYGVDASDISNVDFILKGGSKITSSFAHTHPEYLLEANYDPYEYWNVLDDLGVPYKVAKHGNLQILGDGSIISTYITGNAVSIAHKSNSLSPSTVGTGAFFINGWNSDGYGHITDFNYKEVTPALIGAVVPDDLLAYQLRSEKNVANGYAGLDANGLLFTNQLPPLAISTTYVVTSETEQLALTVQEGDIAVRTDLSQSFIALNSTNASMADWQQLLTPVDNFVNNMSWDSASGVLTLNRNTSSDLTTSLDGRYQLILTNYWTAVSNTITTNISAGDSFEFVEGNNVSLVLDSATNKLTISSVDTQLTNSEVLNQVLTGFSAATSKINLSATSTILNAFEALEYRVNINDSKVSDINHMTYPAAGIALSTGTAWGTSITDNSTNWNAAYAKMITDIDATDISNVTFTFEDTSTFVGSFAHTHPEYMLASKIYDNYVSWELDVNSVAKQTITSGATVNFVNGDSTTSYYDTTNSTITFNHNTVTRIDGSDTGDTPGYGTSFNVVSSVVSDNYGHITAVNTKSVTIPVSDNTDTIDYINSATFSAGTLTLSGVGNAGASVNLDGRYLQSFTETDPIFIASTVYNIADGIGFLKNDGAGTWSYDSTAYYPASNPDGFITSYTDTWRGIDNTPTSGNTAISISSDWAYQNVKTPVPVNAIFTDTTYYVFTDTTDGLVPSPLETGITKYLREDGTWVVPPDTVYTHPTYTAQSISATGAEVLSTFTSDTIGSVTEITTRILTLADLGYYGDTNANYFTYSLPIASSTVLGGIKVGTNLSIDSNGVLSATSGTGTDLSAVYYNASINLYSSTGAGTTLLSADSNNAGLMSAADKVKLDGLSSLGTNLTISYDSTQMYIYSDTGTDVTLPSATTTVAGVMTAADKSKLDSIASGATVYNGWDVYMNDSLQETIASGMEVNFKAGTGISLGYVSGALTINSTVTNTDTNYYLSAVSGDGNGTITYTMQGIADITFNAQHTHSQYLTTVGGTITGTTESSSTTTGALIISGGLGVNGNIWAGGYMHATDFILSSDVRLKTDIENYYPTCLDTQYKSFSYKSEPDLRRFGLIANELILSHPEFVRKSDDGFLSISYIDLHSAEIAYLKAEVKRLNNEINKLK